MTLDTSRRIPCKILILYYLKFFTPFQDHEEPESKMKIFTSIPVLLIQNKMVSMLIKKTVIFTIPSLLEAVCCYLATFYVLDIDYPKEFETGLTILQWIVFASFKAPHEVLDHCNNLYSDFQK